MQALRVLQWEKRPLLVFAPSPEHPKMLRLEKALKRFAPDIEDRDMAIFRAFPMEGSLADENYSAEETKKLRKYFSIAEDEFLMILIGKDGGEKGNFASPDDLPRIFERIDAMPMRRREMRKKSDP